MTYYEYANLTLENSNIPCGVSDNYVSGQCHGMAFGRFMVDPHLGKGYTLGNKTVLHPTLLEAGTSYIGGWGAPRIAMTKNCTFFLTTKDGWHWELTPHASATKLHRVNKFTQLDEVYDPESDGVGVALNFVVYNEDVVFTAEEGADSNTYQICKITFNGNTPTREVVFEETTGWDYANYLYYNSYPFYADEWCMDICCVKSEGNNSIVLFGNWNEDGNYPEDGNMYEWLYRAIIYNIDTDTYSAQWIVPAPDSGISYDLWEGYVQYNTPTPVCFGSKYIITCDTSTISSEDPHYNAVCDYPKWTTVIIDTADNSISQVYNLYYPNGHYDVTQWGGGVIDYNTNTYFFQAFSESLGSPPYGGDVIIAMNLEGTPQHHFYANAELDGASGLEYFQGQDKAYGVNLGGASLPRTLHIYDLATMEVVNTIALYYINGSMWFEAGMYIDRDNDMIWSFGPDKLEGKSLVGGADRDIPILWEGGGIPFTYSFDHMVFFRMLDEAIVVLVTSQSELNPDPWNNWWWQLDVYLLQ